MKERMGERAHARNAVFCEVLARVRPPWVVR
jgi:hypothetical protein